MGKPETFHAWFQLLCPPHMASDFGRRSVDAAAGSIPRSSREKKPLLHSVPRVQFQMAERLKVLTMISHKFHVFWRRTMSTGSLFFLCYKTPQQCDNQETMTSCILLVKYYWVYPTFFDEFYSVFFFFFFCFLLLYLFPSPLINEIYFTFRSTIYSEKLIAWWTQLQTSSCWPETVTMDSKRLFIFIALWLFLSCVLLDHAEGFTLPRKRKRQQRKQRGPNNQLTRRLREMASLASQIWVCTLKMISR